MFQAHQDIRINFIVALLFGVARHQDASLNARFVFSRPQKYLVKNETTSDDFLRCEGGYSNVSMKGIRISMTRVSPTYDHIVPGGSDRYTFGCTPEMPSYSFVSKAFCLLGFKSAERRDAGIYDCDVASGSIDKQAQWHLRVYDNFILSTSKGAQNPKEKYVDEHQPFKLKCRVNLLNSGLEIKWRIWTRSGHLVIRRSLSGTEIYHNYKVSSASRDDEGMYQCVVVSLNDGAKIIDSGNRTIVHIRYAPVAYLSSRPVPVLQNAVTLDNYHPTDYLNCTVKGYPTIITIMKNNVILASMNQNKNTVMLKLSVAKSESAVFVRGPKFQWKAISIGTGFLVLLILSTIIAHVQIRKRRSRRGSSPTEDTETDLLLPMPEEQINFVSGLFSEWSWKDFRDFCRTMVPCFEESFLHDVTEKRAKSEASDDAYWRKYCLKAWMKKYPLCSFLQSAYDALRNGIKDKILARKCCRRFPRLGLGESLEMSGSHSDSESFQES